MVTSLCAETSPSQAKLSLVGEEKLGQQRRLGCQQEGIQGTRKSPGSLNDAVMWRDL